MTTRMRCALVLALGVMMGCRPHGTEASPAATTLEALTAAELDSPVRPLPTPPLGVQGAYEDLRFKLAPLKVRLGRWLFFDPRLSADGTLSCASCHDPRLGFSDNKPQAIGIRGQRGKRKTPALVNIAFPLFDHFFWDGRAATLIEQAKGPMANSTEMGNSHDAVVANVLAVPGYRQEFRRVWGGAQGDIRHENRGDNRADNLVDIDRIAEAIAAYEATRLSGNSAFDRFDQGDPSALSASQRMGRDLFFGKARCTQCHLGWNLTDSRFHNIGIGWNQQAAGKDPAAGFADPGRSKISGRAEDSGAFKTPTLRDVALHPPYMHDGSLATLKDVIDHYNRGGTPNPWLDPKMSPLGLSPDEVNALVAFMEALSGEGYQDTPPKSFPNDASVSTSANANNSSTGPASLARRAGSSPGAAGTRL